jgi:hypothetical protein
LLYQRNLLFYDRRTFSLWSQLGGMAVAGPLAGTQLRMLPATETTWKNWQRRNPDTLVLSFQTGYRRDYGRDPYASFSLDRRPCLVVIVGGQAKIYPFSQLKKTSVEMKDSLGGRSFEIRFNRRNHTAHATAEDGKPLAQFVSFLVDARAFYPRAPVFKAK